MAATSSQTVPGPTGHPLLGHARELRQDPMRLFTEGVGRYGDVVSFYLWRA